MRPYVPPWYEREVFVSTFLPCTLKRMRIRHVARMFPLSITPNNQSKSLEDSKVSPDERVKVLVG